MTPAQSRALSAVRRLSEPSADELAERYRLMAQCHAQEETRHEN